MVRLMVQGEARLQASLLRLMMTRKNPEQPTLLSLLTMGLPSVLDIVMKGEESAQENSLARIVLGTTIMVQNGSIKLGGALGSDPGGLTLAKACMLGEEVRGRRRRRLARGRDTPADAQWAGQDGGPGISILRMLLLGEDVNGISVLRLLLTGEDKGLVSPLRVIFTGFQGAFVASRAGSSSKSWREASSKIIAAVQTSLNDSHMQGSTWRDSFDKLLAALKDVAMTQSDAYVAFLWTASQQIKDMGPEFSRVWAVVWQNVGDEVRRTGERMRDGAEWKTLAPYCVELAKLIGGMEWQKAIVQLAVVLSMVESRNRSSWLGPFSKWVPMFA
jgi:hypothetical protein